MKFKRFSLAVADAVLALCEALIPEHDKHLADTFYVECYSNGREQGYVLCGHTVRVAFSQYRGSDSIVVYVGGRNDLHGSLDDRIYKGRRTFDESDIYLAAELIVEELRKDTWFVEQDKKVQAERKKLN